MKSSSEGDRYRYFKELNEYRIICSLFCYMMCGTLPGTIATKSYKGRFFLVLRII